MHFCFRTELAWSENASSFAKCTYIQSEVALENSTYNSFRHSNIKIINCTAIL